MNDNIKDRVPTDDRMEMTDIHQYAGNEIGSQGLQSCGVEYFEPPVSATVGSNAGSQGDVGRVCNVLEGAPVQAGAFVPLGYKLDFTGVSIIIKDSYRIVVPMPLVIVARFRDILTNDEMVELAWFRDKHWSKHQVTRKTIADVKELVGLADKGVLVTSSTARNVCDYLLAYEVENPDVIPLYACSGQLGWQADDAFLWGARHLAPNDAAGVTDVTFIARDGGDHQFAEGLVSKGTLENWVAMVNKVSHFDTVFMVVMASLAAPFLQVLDAVNFVLDLAGETSKGKTTSERLAAAAWGDPVDGSATSIIHTWTATPVFLDRRASLLNGIPLFIDDTKTASSPAIVSEFVYSFVSGRGKGRGTINGTQQSSSYSTILITSGEQSIADIGSHHGGLAARVLSLWGAPFGPGDNSELVNELERIVAANHGHAGPQVVQFILDHRDDWPLWDRAYQGCIQFWAKHTEGNGPANRLSKNIAFLSVVIPLVHAAIPGLKIARPMREILKDILQVVKDGAQQADRATDALKKVWEWAATNPTRFWGRHTVDSQGNPKVPYQGWAGRWWSDKGEWIGFTTESLVKILSKNEVPTMTKTWNDRGWLTPKPQGQGLQVNTKINGRQVLLYKFAVEKVKSILGLLD